MPLILQIKHIYDIILSECFISNDKSLFVMSSIRSAIRKPGQKMAIAKRTGLVSLLEMIKRGEEQYSGVYQRSLKIWRGAWAESIRRKKHGDRDYFIPICRVEKHLRKNHHKMIFNTAALFGSTETKRIYSWDEGTIGPLNALLNLGGARLRFLGMSRYPFPTPIKMEYEYTKKDGTTKQAVGYGYPGSVRSTKIILAHPALQPLDFVDMIRALVNELCRQCFICSVPNRDALVYIDLLIFKLRPFLDHIYTGEKTGFGTKIGTSDFVRRGSKILDEILQRIHAEYGNRNGRPQRVTQRISVEEQHPKSTFTLDDVKPSKESLVAYNYLKSTYGKFIDQRDFNKLAEGILRNSGSRGTSLHRRVSWGFTRPTTNRTVVLGGDYYAENKSGYLVAADVPVLSGYGRADFVLYVRQNFVVAAEDERSIGLWRPVMVLDIKSKNAYDCGFVGSQLKGSEKVVPEIVTRKRSISDMEWEQIIQNCPTFSEKAQVEFYGSGLLADYQRLANDESKSSSIIISGILLVDESVSPSIIRNNILAFLVSSYEQIQDDLRLSLKEHPSEKRVYKRSVFRIDSNEEETQRIVLVTLPLEIASEINLPQALPFPNKIDELHRSNPFRCRIEDKRSFVLYVSGGGRGAGEIASWIARYWHGIGYARLLAKREKRRKLLWLDLAGEFSNRQILTSFLRRYPPAESVSEYISYTWKNDKKRRRYLREFVNSGSIDIHDMSIRIIGMLFEGKEPLSQDELADLVSNYDMFIVSGMDTLWRLTPPRLHGLLIELCIKLTKATDISNTITLWFDNAIPTPETSQIYKSRRYSPLPHDSPLQTCLDKIVLNFPIPPTPGISESSFADEIRQIIELDPNRIHEPNYIEILPLRGWSNRFRADTKMETGPKRQFRISSASSPLVSARESVDSYYPDDCFDFLSSSVRRGLAGHEIHKDLAYTVVKKQEARSFSRTSEYKGVLSRVQLHIDLCNPLLVSRLSRRKTQRYCEIKLINLRRKYWTPRLQCKPLESVALPLYESQLTMPNLDFNEAARIEFERILDAVSVLSRLSKSSFPDLNGFLRSVISKINHLQLETNRSDSAIIQKLVPFFDRIDYSQSVSRKLAFHRTDLYSWNLPYELNTALREVQARDRDTLLQFGNYFIMIFAALQEFAGEFALDRLQQLWDSVRPWVLLQIGTYQIEKARPFSEFDMKKIFDQLFKKTESVSSIPEPANPIFDEIRYGISVDSHTHDETEEPIFTWYVFEKEPYSDDFISGCLVEKSKTTVIPLDEQAETARLCTSSSIIHPILLCGTYGIQSLYVDSDENEYSDPSDIAYQNVEWQPKGHVRYGTRHIGALARLKWLNTSYYAQFPIPGSERLPRRPPDMVQKMIGHLEKVATHLKGINRVTCEVEGVPSKGIIKFRGLNGMHVGELNFHSTQQAIEILRSPFDFGVPLGLNRKMLTWHPVSGVSYSKESTRIRDAVVKYIDISE
jgi:hypothetical protein